MVLNEDGEVVKTEFVVEGRKQPLVEIRERTLKTQAKFNLALMMTMTTWTTKVWQHS